MMRRFFMCLLAGMAMAGCSRPQSDAGDANLDVYEVEEIYTAYDEQYEWYVLAGRLEAGREAPVLVHITRLEDFKPVLRGSATLTLDAGGSSLVQNLEEMDEPGIFSFAVMPPAAGQGHMVISLDTGGEDASVELGGITVHPARDDSHNIEPAHETSSNSITFTKEQSWMIDFATAQVGTQPFGPVIRAIAQIQPAVSNATVISAKTSGIVVISGNAILEGNAVEKDKMLFMISGSGMAENNTAVRYHEALNNMEKAGSDFQRLQALYIDKIVSEKEYLKALTDYENAKLVFENLNRHFTEEGEAVVSPLSGYVHQSYVLNGQYVEAGQPLISVYADRELILRVEVPQEYLPRLASITGATLHDPVWDNYFTLEELNGTVLSVGRSTGTNSLLIPVFFRIRNNGAFVPGSFLEVYLQTKGKENEELVVPLDALIEEMGSFFIYVQQTPELFEKREVHTGATDGINIEITEGLSTGERIVTRGAIMIKLSSAGGNLDPHAGHIH